MCLVRVEKIKIYFKFIKFIILSCEIGERMNVLTTVLIFPGGKLVFWYCELFEYRSNVS